MREPAYAFSLAATVSGSPTHRVPLRREPNRPRPQRFGTNLRRSRLPPWSWDILFWPSESKRANVFCAPRYFVRNVGAKASASSHACFSVSRHILYPQTENGAIVRRMSPF